MEEVDTNTTITEVVIMEAENSTRIIMNKWVTGLKMKTMLTKINYLCAILKVTNQTRSNHNLRTIHLNNR